MTFVVETGEGMATATSFVAVADADAYHAARGNTTWTGDTSEKEAALIRTSAFLTHAYKWVGQKRRNRDQALAWPRVNVVDADGFAVDFDQVPVEIKMATYEVALRELVSPGSMTPDVTLSSKVKSEKIGSIAVEYLNSNSSASADIPTLTIVDGLVSAFALSGANSSAGGVFGRAVRA